MKDPEEVITRKLPRRKSCHSRNSHVRKDIENKGIQELNKEKELNQDKDIEVNCQPGKNKETITRRAPVATK